MDIKISLNPRIKEEKEILDALKKIREEMKTTPYTPVYTRSIKRLLMNATNEYNEGEYYFERSIEFPEQSRLAGLQLLSYFADRINRSYNGQNVKVLLKQTNGLITLVIKSDDEELLREIELDLEKYGEVLLDKRSINSFVDDDKLEIIRLQSSLNIAKVQIETERSLRQYQSERLESVERQNQLLNEYVGTILQLQGKAFEVSERISGTNLILSKTIFDKLGDIRNEADDINVIELLRKIEESYINLDIFNNKEQIKNYLEEIRKRDKKTFKKLREFGGEMSNSVAGNLLWELIQMIPF